MREPVRQDRETRSHLPEWIALGIVLLAGGCMAAHLDEPIYGRHCFRQAHVQSNIERFLEGTSLLRPATYNVDLIGSFYDLPIYQWTVFGLCRLFQTDPLWTARLSSLLITMVTCGCVWSILNSAGASAGHRLLTLSLFAFAPLVQFYGVAPMVDGLANLAVLAMAAAYLKLRRNDGRRSPWVWALLVIGGLLGSSIKSPVAFPLGVAILLDTSWSLRSRFWKDAVLLVSAAGMVVGLLLHYVLSKQANAGVVIPNFRASWIFGKWEDRMSPGVWGVVYGHVKHLILNPTFVWLVPPGIILWIQRRRSAGVFFLAWLVGCSITLLVFLNLYRKHDYYVIPMVFPVVFFVGCSLDMLLHGVRRLGGRSSFLQRTLVVAALSCTVWIGKVGVVRGFRELGGWGWETCFLDGEWVRARTAPDDFVFYARESSADWNPAPLYYVRRQGANIGYLDLFSDRMQQLLSRGETSNVGSRRYLLFLPSSYGQMTTLATRWCDLLHQDAGGRRLFLVRDLTWREDH